MDHCSIPDCDKPRYARGWCRNHYARWFRTGTPQGTGTSPGEPARFLNEVVLTYEVDECLTWPYSRDTYGYGRLPDGSLVHRIACEKEHGPPPSPKHETAHSCGNGHNACVARKHLRWATRAENADDKVNHGRSSRGVKNPKARLTEDQVRSIRDLAKSTTQIDLARQFGVSKQTISLILKRGAWGWLD